MTEPILCHDCGHNMQSHLTNLPCLGCYAYGADPSEACKQTPTDIARAYGEQRFNEGWKAHELRWAVGHSE